MIPYLETILTAFKYPEYLWGIPISLIVILFLVRRNFVTFSNDQDTRRRIRRMRTIVYFLRNAAIILLLVALATPFTTISHETEGNPRALMLVDQSASMELYDTSFIPFLTDELSSRLPTTVKNFGTIDESPVGDAALGHPDHLLIISDGNANVGVDIRDVAQVARQNNLTLSIIALKPTAKDSAVRIDAPQTVPLGFPTQIRVEVTSTSEDPVPLIVSIDGKEVYRELTRGTIEIDPELNEGYHRIEARITSSDTRADNDVHYGVIEVLPRPKIFVLSGSKGPLERGLEALFDVTTASSLPSDLTPYGALVINDRKAGDIGSATRIADYLRDEKGGKYGNGLVVIGGLNSFDRGGYQRTELESLLPVKVGKPKRELGDNSLVFVIQISGSTGGTKYIQDPDGGGLIEVKEDVPVIDIIKSQAISAINSLNLKNNIGVVAFGVNTQGQDFGSAEEALSASVVKIASVEPLHKQKSDIVDSISRLQGGGTTAPDLALRAAVDMLKDRSGSRTIIFLTNGRFSAGLGDFDAGAKADVESIIGNAQARYGIKTHVIGVGSSDFGADFSKKVDETFLTNMAKRADGLYDRATNMARLILEYGDPDEKGFGEDFRLVTLSLTHFITRDLELNAVLNGYNEVAPKDGSRILVKTDAGNPALTTWNYFNGRVAVLTAFTGSGLGPLLSPPDSDLVRNTIQWAIGDPRRKQDVTVTIDPAITGKQTHVTFVSKEPINGACTDTRLDFAQTSGDAYVFTFDPGEPGFHTVCQIPYAVNGPSEFWHVGPNADLEEAVRIAGGEIFEFDQVDEIVDRITTVSTRMTVEKTELRSPFVALALIVFLLEIFIRRLTKHTS